MNRRCYSALMKLKNIITDDEGAYDELIIGLYESTSTNQLVEKIDQQLGGKLKSLLKHEHTGSFKDIITIHTFDKTNAKKLYFLELGKKEELTFERLREGVAYATRTINTTGGEKEVGLYVEPNDDLTCKRFMQAISEGFHLGMYLYEGYKSHPTNKQRISHLTVHVDQQDIAEVEEGQKVGEALIKGTNLARNLMNEPANYLTPIALKDKIVSVAKKYQLPYEVLDKEQLKQHKMGGMLSVSQGSVEDPYVVTVKYEGDSDSNETIGLIGKGVTFDTGGISLKSKSGLEILKKDMGGSATMIGVLEAIGRLRPKANILLVVGCVENMPSGSAYKPGDVITMMNGQTVEIISTDAEGRLVLGDCITYAKQLGVTSMIDCATLTGACRIGLGYITAGVMSNNESMLDQFLESSKQAGERAWPLPMFPEYRDYLTSRVADMKNSAGGGIGGGASIAAKFLEEFVEDTPWVHLDISSSGFIHSDTDLMPYGATGAMVRTIAHYILQQT